MRFRLALLATVMVTVVSEARAADAASAPRQYRVATFQADVTIPVGHACMGGGIPDVNEIIDPLFAKGFVLLGGSEQPVVLVAVDFCQLNNDAFDRWRAALAEAAGTAPQRVMLATVHQHDAPICDLRAQALLDTVGLKNSLCDPAFHEKVVQRTSDALRKALDTPRPVSQFGIGQAAVERVASNRRVAGDGGNVHWGRHSASREFDNAPEGEVDPYLKTFSLWDGDRPVVAWSSYAVHPMSHYGQGKVSADFVGMARARREADDPAVMQIYFTGCAGDTTAGKYNDGRPEERAVLADRLYQAMTAAWKSTRRLPLDAVAFRSAALRLPAREGGDFDLAAMRRILADPAERRWRRNSAALGLSWRERSQADHPIDVPCLDLGAGVAAQFVILPAETFVGYQLLAQRLRPHSSVMVAGFGDGAPGYLPTDACYVDGYHDDYSWVQPNVEAIMTNAIRSVIEPH